MPALLIAPNAPSAHPDVPISISTYMHACPRAVEYNIPEQFEGYIAGIGVFGVR